MAASASSSPGCAPAEAIASLEEAHALLRAQGYECLDGERLTEVGSGNAFTFRGQEHYNKLGDALQEFVYAQMRHLHGLVPFTVTRMRRRKGESQASPAATTIWRSEHALDTKGPVLVLVQGCGVVRPGVWARSIAINSSLRDGCMFRWVEDARRRGWEVLILNPNDSNAGGSKRHASAVWKEVLSSLPASKLLVLAHSRGGMGACQLAREEGAAPRIAGIAMTDAMHNVQEKDDPPAALQLLRERCVDWKASPSEETLSKSDRLARWVAAASKGDGIPVRPAFVKEHPWTTPATFDATMAFLQGCLDAEG